jgi:ABC-type multidrug transport system fused ATPase/permease subunit
LHVLQLDPSFHSARSPGELIERTDGDVSTLGNFFSRLVVYVVGNALLLVGVIALLVVVDWRIGTVMIACTALAGALMHWLQRLAVPRNAALRQASADLFGLIEERLAGTEDVRANGAVPYVLSRLLDRSRTFLWRYIPAQVIGTGGFRAATLCLHVGTVLALAVAVSLFRAGELTLGAVYLVIAYAQSLRRPVEAITRQLQDLQQAAASIGRVQELLAERSEVVDGLGAPLPPGPLAVEIDRVSFAYVAGPPVLRDVSLRLGAGQVLGLLGRTGAGKTTLARLLFRLFDPQEGAIRLSGIDLREQTLLGLRSRIAFVTQDVQLFHASIRDNVTFFDPTISNARVQEVLDEVGLDAWLRRLPGGVDTTLAPEGGGLSAGEAQLLALARAFLADPGLVVLDEASSRLDPATERRLEAAVGRLLAGRTAIVIAHRLSTVQRADRILILEDGRVSEEGERAALAADPGSRFSRLLRAGLEAAEVPA